MSLGLTVVLVAIGWLVIGFLSLAWANYMIFKIKIDKETHEAGFKTCFLLTVLGPLTFVSVIQVFSKEEKIYFGLRFKNLV